ncbi:MAG: FAD/NAD(P)-binding oxidoreductase [Bacillota bacterium]|nr:MAG: pyridine nucleotide-disulfide oxidoreductase [Bacillota bacterium]
MAKELLVVGAGTGGLMLSNQVARQLAREIARGEVRVTLLGDRDEYLYQPGLLYIPFGRVQLQDLIRPVRDLLVPGVTFLHDRAERIDPETRTVTTRGGRRLTYDYLVLATGSHVDVAQVPGLAEGGHWFYTVDGALRLRETLARFSGGRVVIAAGLPYKCPVAPLEFTFLLDEWTRERGIRDKTEIVYAFPLGRAHSIESVADWAAAEFEKRGIRLETFFNLESVDPVKQEVTSLEGTTLGYDLLVVIPPHRGDTLARDSGLTGGDTWIPTDRHTLQVGRYDNIFAIGDATGLPVSKAGSVAHFQAEVLAANLVSLLTGGSPSHRYNGKAFCFIETGLDRATYITFDYTHPPQVTPPTRWVHLLKQAYNRIHWLNLKAVL